MTEPTEPFAEQAQSRLPVALGYALGLAVLVPAAVATGLWMSLLLLPAPEPVARFALSDLAPQPGFDL